MGGAKAQYDGVVAFSQTDFTEDLKQISVPVLVMHGEDDQIVPYADSGPLSAKLVKNGTLKSYPGSPTACRPLKPQLSTLISWPLSGPDGVLSAARTGPRGGPTGWVATRVAREHQSAEFSTPVKK